MDIYLQFLYFISYSFLGWISETIYCSIPAKRFVYRGFLNGPITPIYGFGAMFVIILFTSLKDQILLLFIASMILTSALEYITSYLMEKLFDMKWWDYSERRFNINGRVRLQNSLLFGLGSVFVIHWIHPAMVLFYQRFDAKSIELVASILFIILIADTTITTLSIFDLRNKILAFEHKMEDRLGIKQTNILNRRILEAFPNLQDRNNPDLIHRMRKAVRKYRKELLNIRRKES